MTGPLVSVITPVHNGAEYLAECIASVLRQTYTHWELLVVDNKSTDRTAEVAQDAAQGDPRVQVRREEEFLGVYGNHNRALRAVSPAARYVKFVHADDWLFPECLERMVAVAEAHPMAGVVSAFRMEGEWVLHDGLLPYTQQVMPGCAVVGRALLGKPWVTGSPTSLLFRADRVRETPAFFDESVWHADTDAAYRVLLRSELGFVHQVLTFTRVHPGALTRFSHRVNTYLPHELRMTLRYGPTVLSHDEYRTLLRRGLRLYLWYLARQALKPSRRSDPSFHEFHRREIARLLEETADARVRSCLRLGLRLLRSPR